jgi:hypothetical protein
MKDQPLARPKHLQEHTPTVIHDPLADETMLARWFRQTAEKGPKAWLPWVGVVLGAIALWVIVANLRGGRSASAGSWEALMLAQDTDDRIKVGQEAPGLPGSWALLQAAEARYQEAFGDLPNNRDVALPMLSNAHDLFRQAYEKAPADSVPRRLAALGMGRCLEARGDLEGAIQQYQTVARAWPDSDEGKQAARLAELLRKPESVAFYQKFSTYKPPEVTLPPRGTGTFDLPGMPDLPPSHPPLDGPTVPAPGLGLPDLTPPTAPDVPPPAPTPEAPASTPDPLPPDPFAGEPATP